MLEREACRDWEKNQEGGTGRKRQRQRNGERQLEGEEEESEQSEIGKQDQQSRPLWSSVLTSVSRESDQSTSNLKATGSHGKTGAAWSRDIPAKKFCELPGLSRCPFVMGFPASSSAPSPSGDT